MKAALVRFNIFLLAAVLAGASGCQGPGKAKDMASVRVHLEVNPDGTERNGPVPIGRSALFRVNVEKAPFLTEQHLHEATLVNAREGFALRLTLTPLGTRLLEQYSTAYRGKRAAVFAQWEEQARWLAAPRMDERLTNGVFTFTPDASRDEVERLVQGLNRSAKAIHSGRF